MTKFSVEHEAQERWSEEVASLVEGTPLEQADSWYTGANVPGKHRGILAYTGGIVAYFAACNAVAQNDYAGFAFAPADELCAAE